MLWPRPGLLGLAFYAALILSLFYSHEVSAQIVEDSAAPWRINLENDSDLEPAALDSSQFVPSLKLLYRTDNPPPENVTIAPYRTGVRFGWRDPRRLFIGLAAEKDAGERQFWDHTALALSFSQLDDRLTLILGDYLVGYGTGLVIRTKRNYGLGLDAEGNLSFIHRG